jgi:hypothetical protein
MQVKVNDSTKFAKRMFYLLWQACGGPRGMGILQNRPDATEDDVWYNIQTAGDYPIKTGKDLYADYVFGRMMKFGCKIVDKKTVEFPKVDGFRADYQGWCIKYNTLNDILDATVTSLADDK